MENASAANVDTATLTWRWPCLVLFLCGSFSSALVLDQNRPGRCLGAADHTEAVGINQCPQDPTADAEWAWSCVNLLRSMHLMNVYTIHDGGKMSMYINYYG